MTVHTTTSLFLVVADQEPRHVDLGRHRFMAVSAVFRACGSPLDPREIRAYADWDGPDPPPSTYHAVLSAVAPANRQPRSAQITRAFARTMVAQSGGLLIDWVTREIVRRAYPAALFDLGDQWLGFEHHVHDERHQSPSAEACAALRLQTRGLVRFGLPEIGIDRVDCGNRLVALNVLRALAQHLLGGLPGRVQHVSRDAFGAYWARHRPATTASPPLLPNGATSSGSVAHTKSHSTIGSPASRGVSNGWRPALPTTSRHTTRSRCPPPARGRPESVRFCGLLSSYCGSLANYLRSAG